MKRTKSEISNNIRSLTTNMSHEQVAFALGNNDGYDFTAEESFNIFYPKNRWDIVEEWDSSKSKNTIISFNDLESLEKLIEGYDYNKHISF